MVPHAAGVGVASVLHQECSGLRTPLSKTCTWAPLELYLKASCSPPLRPRAPALAPSPWSGFVGAPFCFAPLFPLFFSPSPS